MARNTEKALYRVIDATGRQWEVEADDKRDLQQTIYKGLLIAARYVGSSGAFNWSLNGRFIVSFSKEEARASASSSDESTTKPTAEDLDMENA